MESQPQNPEFRISPENFHPCAPQALMYAQHLLDILGLCHDFFLC